MELSFIRNEIELRRRQIMRQRKEIQALQRAGISTRSAEELLARMLSKVDYLGCFPRLITCASSATGRCENSESNTWVQTKQLRDRSSGASDEACLVRPKGG